MDLVFACIGVSISLYGVIAYIVGIVKHGTRPRMASWVAWGTANTVFTVVALSEGSYLAAGINAIAALTNITVIAFSLKKGILLRLNDWIDWACMGASVVYVIKRLNDWINWACMGASVVCVIMTVVVQEVGALFAILANITATIPTIIHAWTEPHEENWRLFAANVAAGSLGVIGIMMMGGTSLASIAGPLITALGNTGLVLITVGRGFWCARTQRQARTASLARLIVKD